MPTAITVSELDYRLGDDTEIFSRLTATIPADLVGLVGDNGIGKSTFARILAGRLRASSGTVTGADGAVYIDQLLPHSTQRVDAALDIAPVRQALGRALAGEATGADFDLIGDDWDIEERALAALSELGLHLSVSDLDRSLSSFSGGQATRIGLARAALVGDTWLILDEPSNNLDEDGRTLLTTLLTDRRGPTLVISHDRTLLTHMTSITEMTTGCGSTEETSTTTKPWSPRKRRRSSRRSRMRRSPTRSRSVSGSSWRRNSLEPTGRPRRTKRTNVDRRS
ncbi:ATP-binding cassette domain-containing protein [Brevibacterium sp. JSBI002]|uniref:ATP-binding cassette domain-containing protein n=1 Tax=Brevibacterium sp. JSBI002 TaxID=2886045 RepID=UPI0022304032|nr:ATP-binding cassette domain-containing protein [Brevibacterium sp. JSBI002]UZD60937.1 ATP-binding cassette domain-containing protein [Brevibacterium sp. JSBI002]